MPWTGVGVGLTNGDHQRAEPVYFLTTYGRSGSSFQCYLIHFCGGNLGLPVPHKVDSKTFHFEHTDIARAVQFAEQANRIGKSEASFINSRRFKIYRSLARRKIRNTVVPGQFVKTRRNAVLVPIAAGIGFQPKIIVSYRDFRQILLSDIRKQKNVPSHFMPDLLKEYTDSLYLMHSFGGVALDFAEVLDSDQTAWASALEELTGLDAAKLIEARAEILGSNRVVKSYGLPLPTAASDIEAYIQGIKNQLILPSCAALGAQRLAGEQSAA